MVTKKKLPIGIGKSLNMDMLKTFFEIDTDPSLFDGLGILVSEEAGRFSFLLESDKLIPAEKKKLNRLIEGDFEKAAYLHNSLRLLTQLLCKHYETPVIALIDEYDVPLDKAHQNGYYPKMTALIRSLFSQALKTNKSLYFAVITGCLRIARESFLPD